MTFYFLDNDKRNELLSSMNNVSNSNERLFKSNFLNSAKMYSGHTKQNF